MAIKGRFDQHVARAFAARPAEDDPHFAQVLRWTILAACLLGFVVAAGAALPG